MRDRGAGYAKPNAWMRLALASSVALLLLAGCETRIDKETGKQTTNVTIPGTTVHGFRMQDRWNRCMEFHSRSYCERRHRAASRGDESLVTRVVPRENRNGQSRECCAHAHRRTSWVLS